jgi:hypothetical protein
VEAMTITASSKIKKLPIQPRLKSKKEEFTEIYRHITASNPV